MPIKKNITLTLLLVTDSSKARFFSIKQKDRNLLDTNVPANVPANSAYLLDEINTINHPEGRMPMRELNSDLP